MDHDSDEDLDVKIREREKGSVGYRGAHKRVEHSRGHASLFNCEVCGKPAAHWALNQETLDVMCCDRSDGYHALWSLDPCSTSRFAGHAADRLTGSAFIRRWG
jgi:hypothetical protein